MNITERVKSYFEPSPDGVRVRDFARELPGATFNMAKSISGVDKLGQGVGKAIYAQTGEGKDLTRRLELGQVDPQEYEDVMTGGLTNKEVVGSAMQTGALFVAAPVGKATAGLSLPVQSAAGAATGYAFDVGRNLQDNEEGAQLFKPGLGTALGAIAPVASKIDVAHPFQSTKQLFTTAKPQDQLFVGGDQATKLPDPVLHTPTDPQEKVDLAINNWVDTFQKNAELMLGDPKVTKADLIAKTLDETIAQVRASGIPDAAQKLAAINPSKITTFEGLRKAMIDATSPSVDVFHGAKGLLDGDELRVQPGMPATFVTPDKDYATTFTGGDPRGVYSGKLQTNDVFDPTKQTNVAKLLKYLTKNGYTEESAKSLVDSMKKTGGGVPSETAEFFDVLGLIKKAGFKGAKVIENDYGVHLTGEKPIFSFALFNPLKMMQGNPQAIPTP